MSYRFLLVDDHSIVRRGLRDLLAEEFAGAEFGEAASGPEALALVARQPWSLMVLDVSIPGRDGLDVLEEVHALHPQTRVLVLSGHDEEQYAMRALRAGASGYVSKDTAPDELCRAVHKVLAGGRYVSSALAEKLADQLARPGERAPHELLSNREMQVLKLLARGRSVKDIGAELSLSEKTISTYRTRILEKMNLKSNAELMRYALKTGLVD
ncbi:MAG TPA: response regulator transcription factor [Kofleriaceae bacterium]|jgi:DNA-binding NarL/FixJ family response regulator